MVFLISPGSSKGGCETYRWVDEADGTLARRDPGVVRECDDRSDNRRAGGRAIFRRRFSVDDDIVVLPVCRYVGVSSRISARVPSGVDRCELRKVALDRGGLVGRQLEDVGETATAESRT